MTRFDRRVRNMLIATIVVALIAYALALAKAMGW